MLKLGSRVLSICTLDENGLEICRPGDRGRVVHIENSIPLVRFQRTNRASIMDPDTEIIAAVAQTPATA